MEVPDHHYAVARILMPLVVGALCLGAAGCGTTGSSPACGRDGYGMPTCPVTVKFIESQPEASLVYPGSTVLQRTGSAETHDAFTTNPAILHVFAATTAPMATVYAWYRMWLTTHGWQAGEALALSGPGIGAQAYSKGPRESFDVQQDSQQAARMLGYRIPARLQSDSLFETIFIIEPYKS